MLNIAGLDTLLPSAPSWAVTMAESIHQRFEILPSDVIVSGKNLLDREFRSVEHSVAFRIGQQFPDEATSTQYDVTAMATNQANQPFLLKYFPDMFAKQVYHGENGTLVIEGVAKRLWAHTQPKLAIPSHSLAAYVAGYTGLVFIRTLPESIVNDQATATIHNRSLTAATTILNALQAVLFANIQRIDWANA